MNSNTLRLIAIFAAGFVFAIGLGISGMTLPENVVGFLDVTGDWKPELMFVMGGAIAVHLFAYLLVPKLQKPLFEPRFGIPSRRDIDPRLIGGAVLFGAGWGLGGFCPGPAMVSTVAGSRDVLIFVVAMIGGMLIMNAIDAYKARHAKVDVEIKPRTDLPQPDLSQTTSQPTA